MNVRAISNCLWYQGITAAVVLVLTIFAFTTCIGIHPGPRDVTRGAGSVIISGTGFGTNTTYLINFA